MAKIGYLYLNKETWDNTVIVAEDWVRESTSAQIQIPPPISEDWPSYGFLWWISAFRDAYSAVGHDGQYIFVLPDQDSVVVITAELPPIDTGAETAKEYLPIITDYIIPAMQ